MPDKNTALLQGTLDMLILKTLALEPMHAHGIGLRIEQTQPGSVSGQSGLSLSSV